ncbi:MAG: hypothetical protein ACYC96_09990 [Fimbriimonadaceae bacterium]
MKVSKSLMTACTLLVLAAANAASIPRGTAVTLVFDKSLSSKTAKVGDSVAMHVAKDVVVHGQVVLRAGTREEALIATVSKRGRFGKNASIRLALNPVIGIHDKKIPLQPRTAGASFKGSRTDHAALAAGAGLLVLGPIGLVGGIFIPGKEVKIKPGMKLESEVSHDVKL